MQRRECRIKKDEAEDDGYPVARYAGGEVGAEESAEGGGDFEEHADSDVGEAFADVGYRRSGRGCDDRDKRGADGVADVDFEEKGEHRHNDDASAEAGECAEQARQDRCSEEDRCEEDDAHECLSTGAREFLYPTLRACGSL